MKVKFLGPVQHDADLYQEGDTADLPDAAAKALIEAKAAVDLNAEKAAAKAAKAEAERLAAEQAEAERLFKEAEAKRLADEAETAAAKAKAAAGLVTPGDKA